MNHPSLIPLSFRAPPTTEPRHHRPGMLVLAERSEKRGPQSAVRVCRSVGVPVAAAREPPVHAVGRELVLPSLPVGSGRFRQGRAPHYRSTRPAVSAGSSSIPCPRADDSTDVPTRVIRMSVVSSCPPPHHGHVLQPHRQTPRRPRRRKTSDADTCYPSSGRCRRWSHGPRSCG
jgi:hypothetical protein